MKVRFFYAAASLLSLFIFFVLGEVLIRLFFPGIVNYPQSGKKIDPYAGNPYLLKSKQLIHSHYPNVEYIQSRANYSVTYKINSQGFRESEYSFQPVKRRMLIVGDSVTEGHGVEYWETFAFQLKKEFEKKNLEVLNMGIQGTSFLVHSVNLPRFFDLKPEIILICVNENDWIDDRIHEIQYKDLAVLERPSLFDKSYPSILFKFKLIQFVYYQYYKRIRKESEIEETIYANYKKNYSMIGGQKELDAFYKNRYLTEEKSVANFELTKAYISYIINECNKRNIKVFFTNLTYLTYSPGSSITTSKEFIKISNNLFQSYLNERKIPYFDLSDVVINFYKENSDRKFFIIDDEHPTKEAHSLFANRIQAWLNNILFKN